VRIFQRGQIADHEYVAMSSNGQVGLHQNTSSAIDRCTETLAERGGCNSSGPQYDGGWKPCISCHDCAGFDLSHGGRSANLDSKLM
jgi:hypothetical protein